MHDDAFVEVNLRFDEPADEKLVHQILEYTERIRVQQEVADHDQDWMERLA